MTQLPEGNMDIIEELIKAGASTKQLEQQMGKYIIVL